MIRPIDPEAPSLDMHRANSQRRQRLVPPLGQHLHIGRSPQPQHLRGVVRMQCVPMPQDALKDIEPGGFHRWGAIIRMNPRKPTALPWDLFTNHIWTCPAITRDTPDFPRSRSLPIESNPTTVPLRV